MHNYCVPYKKGMCEFVIYSLVIMHTKIVHIFVYQTKKIYTSLLFIFVYHTKKVYMSLLFVVSGKEGIHEFVICCIRQRRYI